MKPQFIRLVLMLLSSPFSLNRSARTTGHQDVERKFHHLYLFITLEDTNHKRNKRATEKNYLKEKMKIGMVKKTHKKKILKTSGNKLTILKQETRLK